MTKKIISIANLASLSGIALASPLVSENLDISQVKASSEFQPYDFLKDIGSLYDNNENSSINEVEVFGRVQYQYAYVDGSNESDNYDEFRRVRIGAKIGFAKYFNVKVRANMEQGDVDDHSFGFDGYDRAALSFKAGEALGIDSLDSLTLHYGRQKISIGAEGHLSSKKIKTVERSALSRNARPSNAIEGMTIDLIVNPDAETSIDYNNAWVASIAYKADLLNWEWSFNAISGETEDVSDERSGLFYGAMIQASKFIIDDKLEVAGRYYFQASDNSEGIRINRRYSRISAIGSNGRGDLHQSIYAGLNYYLCADRAKIMTGMEYEKLEFADQDSNATTLWASAGFYF